MACVCSADFDGINVEVSHTVPNTAKYANLTQILSRSYYPFGFPMADSQGGGSRYGYQGDFAEEDDETGFNHFESREYDPVIGRWMVMDPAGQFASPYLGMGNNPISGVDPDGRYSELGSLLRSWLLPGSERYEMDGEWYLTGTYRKNWDGTDMHTGYNFAQDSDAPFALGGIYGVINNQEFSWIYQRKLHLEHRYLQIFLISLVEMLTSHQCS